MLQRIAQLLRINPPVITDRGLLWGSGADYPTLGSDGWQTGAIWVNTTGAAGTSLYVNEGSVTSCDFVAVDTTAGASAGAINFDDNVTGPLINIETTDPTNDSYTTPFIITGAYSSSADNAIVVSSTNPRPVSFLFEDSGDNMDSANCRAVLSRILLTVDQSGSTINAIRGQIKMLDLVDVTTGIYASVQGYLELAGTNISKTGATLSCFSASLEITTALTVNVGGEAAGIHVETTGAGTITNNGTCAGILIDKAAGAADWPVGALVLNSIVGLEITGASTYAIDIATSGVFRMGVQDTGVDLTTTYPFAIDVQCEANADIVAGATGSTAGIYARYAIETAQTSNTSHIGVWGKLRVKADLADGNNAGVMGWVEISGTTELGGTATTTTAAGNFAVIAASGLDLSTGHLNGVLVDCSVDDAATITGTLTGIRLKSSSGCYGWATGILVDLGTNVGATLELSSTGASIILPQSTNSAASPDLKGLVIAASGAMTATTSGDPTFTGVSVTTPACLCTLDTIVSTAVDITLGAITQTTGTMTSTGVKVTGGTINSGTAIGITLAGALTTGLSISATVGTGISITGTTTKLFTGTATLTGGTALNAFEITTVSTQTHASGYQRSIYCNHSHGTGAATGSSEVNVIAADLQCTSNITQAYCFTAYTGSMTGATVNRVAHYAGYLDAITGTVGASSVAFFETNGGATYNSFIAVRKHGGTIQAIISDMSGGATATNLLELQTAAAPATLAGGTYSTAEGYLAIKIAGSTYRLPFYTAVD